jgi:large subunit ribosomal protein L21
MYAIIRAGGKQAKVEQGDVLDVERFKSDGAVSFTPLLVVRDDGTVISDRQVLSTVTVTAEVLGASAGPKIDTFKYKSKTGYRRRMGHRQKYSRIQVTGIEIPGEDAAPTDGDAGTKAETKKTKKAEKKPKAVATADEAAEAVTENADSGDDAVTEEEG